MSYSRDTDDTIIYDLEDWENFVATEKDSFNRVINKDFPAFLSGVIERYESGIVDYPIESKYFEDALYEIQDYSNGFIDSLFPANPMADNRNDDEAYDGS